MNNSGAQEEAIIFLHVPKTAGTTLNRLIEWEYGIFEMYSVDPVFFKWSSAHLRKLSPDRLRKIRVFKGHMYFGLHQVLPQPSTYITVLRDPVERVLYAFYFMRTYKLHPLYWQMRRENWTLEDFVSRSPRTNVQCKIIGVGPYEEPCSRETFEVAKDNLARYFSVVGLSERFEESLALMKLRFGWQLKSYSSFNVTRARPKRRDLPQSTLDMIAEKNSYDVEFYSYAKELFQQAVDKNAAEVSRIAQELSAARERTRGSTDSTLFTVQSAARKAINRVYSTL